MNTISSVQVLNAKVHLLTVDSLHQELQRLLTTPTNAVVSYLNIQSANLIYENAWYRDFMHSCDLVLCDGKGIQLGARLLGVPVPVQIAYNRWLWSFFTLCQQHQYAVFFLGAMPGVPEKAMAEINRRGYHFRMAGHHGYFNKSDAENENVLAEINAFKPNFLIVGFGIPLQESWVAQNRAKLNTNVTLLGGAYLDWISGGVKLPPRPVSRLGLEWLYRLFLEPKRLGRRYIIGIPVFFSRIARHKIQELRF